MRTVEPGNRPVTRIVGQDTLPGAALRPENLVMKWLPATVRASGAGVAGAANPPTAVAEDADAPVLVVASLEEEDRAGDVVLASGWELAAFEANPVVLWAHNYSRPAIGKALRVRVESGHLKAEILFASTPFAREVRSLYLGGFMRGVSVGFRAIETERRRAAGGRPGILFKRQELLEISAAPVPLNPGALAAAVPEDVRDAAQVEALARIRELWASALDVVA